MAKRAWQRMLSGRVLDIGDPTPADIEITDIAHGLCRVARWNGQTKGKYIFSVAQHSLLVEQIMRRNNPNIEYKWLLAGLLHDGAEYVIGDMISPFKNMVEGNFKTIEKNIQIAINICFGLDGELPVSVKKIIKTADLESAYLEAVNLAGFNEKDALKHIGKKPLNPESYSLTPIAIDKMYSLYMKRFSEIYSKM